MTDEIVTDEQIEIDAIRESYESKISELEKTIKERDQKISTLQTFIADKITQPNPINNDNPKTKSFDERYKETLNKMKE
jgi:CRISPR/Cas system CSM-associated protein Csm4 (group 5 of RAMP superfamily)